MSSADIPPFDAATAKRKLDAALDDLVRAAERAVERHSAFAEPACFVSRYTVTRAFGGPEEGGWWFDHYSDPDATVGPMPESVAAEAARQLNDLEKRLKVARKEADRFGVVGTDDRVWEVESTEGEHTTRVRPRYE